MRVQYTLYIIGEHLFVLFPFYSHPFESAHFQLYSDFTTQPIISKVKIIFFYPFDFLCVNWGVYSMPDFALSECTDLSVRIHSGDKKDSALLVQQGQWWQWLVG